MFGFRKTVEISVEHSAKINMYNVVIRYKGEVEQAYWVSVNEVKRMIYEAMKRSGDDPVKLNVSRAMMLKLFKP